MFLCFGILDVEDLLGFSLEVHQELSTIFFPGNGTRPTQFFFAGAVSLAFISPAYQTIRHVFTEGAECCQKRNMV